MASAYVLSQIRSESAFSSQRNRGGLRGGPMTGIPRPNRLSIGSGGFSIDPNAGTRTSRASIEDLIRLGGMALCRQFFSDEQCRTAGDIADSIVSGGGGGGGGGGFAPTECTGGTVYNEALDMCVFPGSPGAGGGGQPIKNGKGVAGMPGAVMATTVGEIQNRPIRRCPPKFVLADPNMFGEGVCFHKATIPNKLRKWPKAPRPPVSAFDAKMMRRYGPGGSKQKKIKTLAGNAGLSCKKK